MPSSLPVHIDKMLGHILSVQPKSVLDVGVGFGKWGFLCREYLDIGWGHYEKQTWTCKIDGCEAFPDYETPTYRYIYDNVFYGNIAELIPTLGSYDLAILGDVIEHLPKDVGLRCLESLAKKCKFILISSPTVFYEQELYAGNEFERHLSFWNLADFAGKYLVDYDEFPGGVFTALLSCDPDKPVVSEASCWASQKTYNNQFFKRRPKLALLYKSQLIKHVPHRLLRTNSRVKASVANER